LLPVVTRGLQVSAGLVRFAEADQGVRPTVAVINVCVGAERLPVEPDCLAVAAGLVVAETDAVKCYGFAEPVASAAVQLQGLLAVPECSLVVAEERIVPADPVKRGGLPGQVAGRAIQAERMLGVVQSLGVITLRLGE